MNDHRLQQTSITPTVGRQTPKDNFTQVMEGVANEVRDLGAGVLSTLSIGNPIASAAVSAVKSVASGISSIGGGGSVGGALGDLGGIGGGAGNMQDLLNQIANGGSGANAAYLQLQMRMQAESQQFTAVSNILKVRSDSAKAAINNIR